MYLRNSSSLRAIAMKRGWCSMSEPRGCSITKKTPLTARSMVISMSLLTITLASATQAKLMLPIGMAMLRRDVPRQIQTHVEHTGAATHWLAKDSLQAKCVARANPAVAKKFMCGSDSS